jgi:hypothetical protein
MDIRPLTVDDIARIWGLDPLIRAASNIFNVTKLKIIIVIEFLG